MKWLPHSVTILGGILGLTALTYHQSWLLLVASLLDAVDGWLARHLGTVSTEGAMLDWTVDILVASATAWSLAGERPLVAIGLYVSICTAMLYSIFLDKRVSGRTLTMVAALFTWWPR